MMDAITQHLDVWTSAIASKATAGRGTSDKQTAYGIKKLRELILELAVRGKLVPQDPDDEPANILLEKIDEEKRNLLRSGEIKKQFSSAEIEDAEIPFLLPKGWEWSRIGNIGRDWGQKTPTSDFTYIDVSSINNNLGLITTPEIVSTSNAPSRARKIVKIGTVIYSTVRPYLKNICVIEDEYLPEPIASTAFAILHPLQNMPGRFFSMYFRSPSFVAYVESVQNGIAYPAINDKQFFNGLVPIPPLNEQHRIVAKVDELMALCDQLEQQQTDHLTAHQTLVQTLLDTLIARDGVYAGNAGAISGDQAADAAEFEQAWSRIADHFDTLFTTESSIDQLKQILLQLAVMGKLVPQDPNDEPAAELLKRIAEKKVQLIKNGEIKKQKQLPDIEGGEKLFEVPNGWEWCKLQEIVFLLGDGLHGTPEYTDNEKFYFINGNNLNNGKILIKPETKTVAQDQYEKHKKQLGKNSVLVSINGTLGNVAFYNNEEIVLGKSACYFNLAEDIYKRFIKVVIDAPSFLDYAYKNATGSTIKNLGLSAMNSLPIALPPINEQHRIVAKVDELMALCDALKARIAAAQTTQLQLADAIVEQAVA